MEPSDKIDGLNRAKRILDFVVGSLSLNTEGLDAHETAGLCWILMAVRNESGGES